jgi:hypothetical protein
MYIHCLEITDSDWWMQQLLSQHISIFARTVLKPWSGNCHHHWSCTQILLVSEDKTLLINVAVKRALPLDLPPWKCCDCELQVSVIFVEAGCAHLSQVYQKWGTTSAASGLHRTVWNWSICWDERCCEKCGGRPLKLDRKHQVGPPEMTTVSHLADFANLAESVR